MNGGRVLKHATPNEVIKETEGKIWKKIISRTELALAENQYDVLSSSYNQDNSINIRVHGLTQPGEGFVRVDVGLEDVYFLALQQGEMVG